MDLKYWERKGVKTPNCFEDFSPRDKSRGNSSWQFIVITHRGNSSCLLIVAIHRDYSSLQFIESTNYRNKTGMVNEIF